MTASATVVRPAGANPSPLSASSVTSVPGASAVRPRSGYARPPVAGAAGGMAAVFATPIAATLLAVELLLFEWRPRSFIPVTVAAVTAAVLRVPLAVSTLAIAQNITSAFLLFLVLIAFRNLLRTR